jgi:hypothetical protein
MHADEKLTAFLELKAATRAYGELPGQANGNFSKLVSSYRNSGSNV